MKIKQYISDRAPLLLLLFFGTAAAEILLIPYHIDTAIRIVIPVIIFLCVFCGMAADFRKRKKYYDELFASLDALDRKYLIHALAASGEFAEARLTQEILYTTGKSMAENVNSIRSEQEDYKEYIELWIHDIKLPIAAAKLISENNKGQFSDSLDEELDKIDSMTENALYYARSGCVEKDYLIRRCALKEIISNCIKNNKKYLIRSRFGIHIENCEISVLTDPKWISFILDQIISNSIKYASSSPLLTFSASQRDEGVVLSITDNGTGIAPDDLPRVFEKGFTGKNGRNEGSRSTGIGLYLCCKLCDKLGILISASSVTGSGTVISLTFPQESFYDI